jgi:transglutaminase-like putative cysteine protease
MMKHKHFLTFCRLVLLAVLVLPGSGTAFTVRADETNRYAGSDWSLLDTAKVRREAADLTAEKFPNCDSATVDGKSVRRYRVDGTGESQDETFVKVLTEKGRRDNRALSFSFMLPYTTVSVPALELIKPDGRVVPVDVAANSKESIDDSQMSENIYDPNSMVLRVNIPKLEIGDIVHLVARQTTERPLIPGEFDDENVFEGTSEIRHLTYEVHAPPGLPLQRIALRDAIPGTVTDSVQTNRDGSRVYFWEIKNVPRMYDETSMPPYEMVLQRLFVSTTPDWQTISKWYWNLSQAHLAATTPEMQKTVDRLTAGATSDRAKIQALFYYVSKNVRYMGVTPEKDRPGFEPHDVCITFTKNYGVCRDKAALLVSLLRLAGFKAYPVLINIGAKRDPEVPEPDFDHAIACVQLPDQDYLLMDPTDENTRDLLPSYDCNRSYLVCRPEGENLLTSPVPPVAQHLMRVDTTGTLRADGHLDAKSELFFDGVNDDEYRNAFSHMKPDDEQRFFEKHLNLAMPGSKLIAWKLSPENMLDMSSKLQAELHFSVDGMTVNGGGKGIVSLPWIGGQFGIVNFLLAGTDLESRKYPLETELTCGLREKVHLQLAADFTGPVAMPTASSVSDPGLNYDEQVAFNPSTPLQPASLDASREFELKTVEFSPAQYLKLKQALKTMTYDSRKSPILATTASEVATAPTVVPAGPVQSDAEILESHKTLAVTDAHTAVYSVKYAKRILTYNGKIREAELKLDYNPACETATLIHAEVISKSGEHQAISPVEIHVMDQGWNPSAKRYPGGKVLVANLPGVEIGSRIEVAYTITMTNQPFLAGYEPFQFPDGVDQKSLQLTAPTNIAVHEFSGGTPDLVTEATSFPGQAPDLQAFVWSATNVPALPAEQQLPPAWVCTAGIGYFIGNVDDYYQQLNTAMLAHAQHSDRASALARSLTVNCTNRLAALVALRDFIVKSIRIAGPTFTELPLTDLSDADTTLSDGYGHLADRAILFDAMLTAAGFQPEFVLASELPPIAGVTNVADQFPLPQAFQTPLVRVTVDGEIYYLNDTDQYSRLGTTFADGKLGIDLATGSLQTLQAPTNCRSRIETTYTVKLSDDGHARITFAHDYYGLNFNEKNQFFSELPPEERDRYHQRIVSELAQGARSVGGLLTRFDTYPGHEEFTVDIDHYAVVDGKYFYFSAPSVADQFPAGPDQRALPLYLDQASTGLVRTEITLPPGFHHLVIEPRSQDIYFPGGSRHQITLADSPGQCLITDQIEVVPGIIPAREYPAVQKAQFSIREKSSRLFLLE